MRHHAAAPKMILASLATVLSLVACTAKDTPNQDSLTQAKAAGTIPDIKVAEVQLGRSIGVDMRVLTVEKTFMPKDTVYVSVSTTGMAQDAALTLVVSPLMGVADSTNTVRDNKTISPSTPSVTEFHFSRPAGLKLGKYKAEVFLNGGLADVKEFEIVRSK